jgi:hypothetical protein
LPAKLDVSPVPLHKHELQHTNPMNPGGRKWVVVLLLRLHLRRPVCM